MLTAPEKMPVTHKKLGKWQVLLLAFLLVSLPHGNLLAGEPPGSIDISPLSKYVKRDILQPEKDQSAGHSEATPAASDPVGASVDKGFDPTSSTQKWNEPAKVEEIHSVDGKKHFLIKTPLSLPFCAVNNVGDSMRQSRLMCENSKF
jgi:hypothetical protein